MFLKRVPYPGVVARRCKVVAFCVRAVGLFSDYVVEDSIDVVDEAGIGHEVAENEDTGAREENMVPLILQLVDVVCI